MQIDRTWLLAGSFMLHAAWMPPAANAGDREYQEAVRQYQAGRMSDAFGRFITLANQGDTDAAHIALFMNKYGPVLYGAHWDAAPHEVQYWASLIRDHEGRPQPIFVPDPYATGLPRNGRAAGTVRGTGIHPMRTDAPPRPK